MSDHLLSISGESQRQWNFNCACSRAKDASTKHHKLAKRGSELIH